MRQRTKGIAGVVSLLLLVPAAVAQQARVQGTVSTAADGTVTISQVEVPLSPLMSEEAKRVLMRSRPTEGPGAPVPVPAGIPDMAEMRRVYNQNLQPVVAHMREVFPVDVEESTIDGISVAIVTPKGGVPARNRNRLMLNGPGGGFRTGVRGNGLLISIPVAATLGVKVVSILYRQAPEYHFPAGSEDLLKVWDHFSKLYKPANIGMVGCSAGGSLITQTTAMLIKAGRPTPGVLGVYCAGLGAQFGGDSQYLGNLAVTNVTAAAATPASPVPPAAAMGYFDGIDMNQFIVTPTRDEVLLKKFPPTIFFTATRDFAMSGAAFGHRKLLKVGVDTDLMIFEGLYHGFMTNPDFPESREGYDIAARFYDRHLGR
jgi:epsilon-lactone hydrolase